MNTIRFFLLSAMVLVLPFSGFGKNCVEHPSLLFTKERVRQAMLRVNSDKAYSKAFKEIKAVADKQLVKIDVRKLEYLALVYQATREDKYGERIVKTLLETAKADSWGDKEMLARSPQWRSELQMAHKSFQLAVAYDAVYGRLSPNERKTIAAGLYRLCVEPLLGDWLVEPQRIHSLNSMGHNWWASCLSMGGLLALSLSNESDECFSLAKQAVEALPYWFAFSGDELQNKPRNFDRSGGMYESINYASFGITEALLLRMAWMNAVPGAKLENLEQIRLLPDFFCSVAYPREGMLYSLNFGDSHKNVTGESALFLAYAMGLRDDNTLWYARQVEQNQHREGFPLNYPMGFLYTPDLSGAPKTPNLPLSHLWQDFGWATLRSSWQKNATMLAVKSGMTWNHSHADANSFVLFHKGVDIIKDAGNCSYSKPEYRNYFFQSQAHNVVLVNGKGQRAYQQYHGTMLSGKVSGLVDLGSWKYVLANGTGPMAESLSRNFRHLLWLDDVLLVVDDLESYEPAEFQWLWHLNGKIRKNGGEITVTNGSCGIVMRPLYPRPLAQSDYVHDYPEDFYMETIKAKTEDLKGEEEYISLHLPKKHDKLRALTAIILKDSVEQTDLPKITLRDGKNWESVRIVHKGKTTDVYFNSLADGRLMHQNSWIEADGYMTDAYMFAVQYPTSKAQDFKKCFIIYGSSLRQGKRVIFSSLAKLTAAFAFDNDVLRSAVTGQERINLLIRSNAGRVFLDGRKLPFAEGNCCVGKQKDMLRIKIN